MPSLVCLLACSIAINILAAIASDVVTTSKMSPHLYELLIAFCKKNSKNQLVIYTAESLELFRQQMLDSPVCVVCGAAVAQRRPPKQLSSPQQGACYLPSPSPRVLPCSSREHCAYLCKATVL